MRLGVGGRLAAAGAILLVLALVLAFYSQYSRSHVARCSMNIEGEHYYSRVVAELLRECRPAIRVEEAASVNITVSNNGDSSLEVLVGPRMNASLELAPRGSETLIGVPLLDSLLLRGLDGINASLDFDVLVVSRPLLGLSVVGMVLLLVGAALLFVGVALRVSSS